MKRASNFDSCLAWAAKICGSKSKNDEQRIVPQHQQQTHQHQQPVWDFSKRLESFVQRPHHRTEPNEKDTRRRLMAMSSTVLVDVFVGRPHALDFISPTNPAQSIPPSIWWDFWVDDAFFSAFGDSCKNQDQVVVFGWSPVSQKASYQNMHVRIVMWFFGREVEKGQRFPQNAVWVLFRENFRVEVKTLRWVRNASDSKSNSESDSDSDAKSESDSGSESDSDS